MLAKRSGRIAVNSGGYSAGAAGATSDCHFDLKAGGYTHGPG
jgi:hypothetical protein